MLERVLCRMQAFRATPPHPILAMFSYFWYCFGYPFPYRFRDRFFYVFSMFLPPVFHRFCKEFHMHFTSLFRYFFGMFFGRLSCRNTLFSEVLLFRRPAFYTVNTMVLTHSAPRKSLVSIPEKNEKKHFFA